MAKLAGHVLKSSNITMQGGLNRDSAYAEQGGASCGDNAQARILEQNPDFALIEISCSCGAKSYLRCEYA